MVEQPNYYPPEHMKKQFHCVHCGVYSAQNWNHMLFRDVGSNSLAIDLDWQFCKCFHCNKKSYWYKERMVVPSEATVPPAHVDMPEECMADYDEARDIVARSPRAAAALLRLTVQKLMPILGERGDNINDDIGKLVQKGLPVQIQQALDFCRVVGNNAVHPGEIEIDDTPEIAHSLFNMMNFIVEDRISRPKHIQTLYDQLPEGARQKIEKRDKPPS